MFTAYNQYNFYEAWLLSSQLTFDQLNNWIILCDARYIYRANGHNESIAR